jgi:regulator of nucleoside diphosphate kinase
MHVKVEINGGGYMQVELRTVNTDTAEVLRGYVERRLRFALGRFGELAEPVSVTGAGGRDCDRHIRENRMAKAGAWLGCRKSCTSGNLPSRYSSSEDPSSGGRESLKTATSCVIREDSMESQKIVITKSDFDNLERLVSSLRGVRGHDAHHIEALEQELEKAIIVDTAEVPRDVVTMNSRVRVRDLKTRVDFVWSIVFPQAASAEGNRVSVLAPIGTALLGYRAGDTIVWQVPSGTRQLRILEVEYQPEAARAAA